VEHSAVNRRVVSSSLTRGALKGLLGEHLRKSLLYKDLLRFERFHFVHIPLLIHHLTVYEIYWYIERNLKFIVQEREVRT
ncbi:MAG: hypothetical protein KDC90_20280, partial [Ignavibacteriae bacterium]|nr:hypothetical protein [Ignavibacteriota bacterium]